MKIGYARVSTLEQNLDAQIKALQDAGCEKIYQEKKSSMKDREQLKAMLEFVREGDIVCVWKLDRLGRQLFELFETISDLQKRNIGFVSISDNIDTNTTHGKVLFSVFALVAELEYTFRQERIAAARQVGRKSGRRAGLSGEADKTADLAVLRYQAKDKDGQYKYSINEIAADLKISKRTLYKYLKIKDVKLNRIGE